MTKEKHGIEYKKESRERRKEKKFFKKPLDNIQKLDIIKEAETPNTTENKMAKSNRTVDIVSRSMYKDLTSAINKSGRELVEVRELIKSGSKTTASFFLNTFETLADYIECAAWEAVEKDAKAGKNLVKLYDIARYFVQKWTEKRTATLDDLKKFEDVRGLVIRAALFPLSKTNWDALKKLTDSETFTNAGKTVTLADIEIGVDEWAKR